MDINIIPPESVGFSSTRLERIHPAMQGYVNKGHPPGIITVVARQGKVVHYECFGLRDVGAGQPMRPDTILRIYSMTKPITAVALMILLEEGRFVLGEPVSKTIPEFKRFKVYAGGAQGSLKLADLEREITILDLLTHTSGLAYGIFPSSPVEALYHAANLNNATSASEFIRRLVELPLAHQPGTAWRYGFAYEVLGHLISIWTDQPFDVFLQERVLGPLGMDDTGFCVPENKLACFAAQYTVTESGDLALTDPPSAASQFARADKPPSGGGGLVSTAADYLRFAQMLLDGGELDGTRVLGRKTVAWMTANHVPAELFPLTLLDTWPMPGQGYGLGVGVVVDASQQSALTSTGAYGWPGFAGTNFWVDPQEELIGLSLPQVVGLLVPVGDVFRNLVYQALVD